RTKCARRTPDAVSWGLYASSIVSGGVGTGSAVMVGVTAAANRVFGPDTIASACSCPVPTLVAVTVNVAVEPLSGIVSGVLGIENSPPASDVRLTFVAVAIRSLVLVGRTTTLNGEPTVTAARLLAFPNTHVDWLISTAMC